MAIFTQAGEPSPRALLSIPLALRDNVRQTALETAIVAHMLDDMSVNVAECPDVSLPADAEDVSFDTDLVGGCALPRALGTGLMALEGF